MRTNLGHGNVDSRKRERRYLEPDERRALLAAAKQGRWAARDSALVLLAYRHGLRCSEIIGLQWQDVKLPAARLFVQRAKHGRNAPHPMQADEVAALKALWKAEGRPEAGPVFASERRKPFSRDGVNKLIERLGERAGIAWRVFPHALRHTCGYELVNTGANLRVIQAWLGHLSLRSQTATGEPKCGGQADVFDVDRSLVKLSHVWAERGSRPPARRDQCHEWGYRFEALYPHRYTGAALVFLYVNAQAKTMYLNETGSQLTVGSHARPYFFSIKPDGTENISLVYLPPYSSEPNPIETVCYFLHQNHLSNCILW